MGESALAVTMGPLGADGYYHLDDRRLPHSTANLDHVLLGPAGVFVVDAKNWTGRIQIDGKSLRQGDRRRDDHLERVRAQAVAVSTLIEEFSSIGRVAVRPVICFVGEAVLPDRAVVERVHLLNLGELVTFIRSFERKLDQASVDELMRALLEQLPARTTSIPKRPRSVAGHDRPNELVLFLQPWAKHGRRRLYVKTSDGSEAGYLDLVTGEVHASADSFRPVLAQLLPHYVTEEATGLQAEALSRGAGGVFRRFVDAVLRRKDPEPAHAIVVGYHWRNFGKDRLYLHRIQPTGSKEEIGWFDLSGGGTHSTEPGSVAILEYCGTRFRDIVAR